MKILRIGLTIVLGFGILYLIYAVTATIMCGVDPSCTVSWTL